MSRWFRHYAGMVRDEKLVRAAVATKQPVERVVWVWGAILESAAEVNDGGRYEIDAGEIAYFLRCDEADAGAILASLESLGRVAGKVVTRWGDRQFESDTSRERQRRYRDRKRDNRDEPKGQSDDTSGESDVTPPSRDVEVTLQETETETDTDISSVSNETSESRPKRSRVSYTAEFEEFWKGYPTDANMSKSEAFDVWKKLPVEERALAIESLPAFRAYCHKQPDYRPVHACRYLAKRRFEGHAAPPQQDAVAESRSAWIASDDPRWPRVVERYVAEKGKKPPVQGINGQSGLGWYFPKDWVEAA